MKFVLLLSEISSCSAFVVSNIATIWYGTTTWYENKRKHKSKVFQNFIENNETWNFSVYFNTRNIRNIECWQTTRLNFKMFEFKIFHHFLILKFDIYWYKFRFHNISQLNLVSGISWAKNKIFIIWAAYSPCYTHLPNWFRGFRRQNQIFHIEICNFENF